jgi:hypothetical protein
LVQGESLAAVRASKRGLLAFSHKRYNPIGLLRGSLLPEEKSLAKAEMTQARVLKIVKGDTLVLPAEFVDTIPEEYGLAIMVVKDKNVKIYPVKSAEVYYLRLEIEKLSKSFLEELTTIFELAGLQDILFTSGICQAAHQCYYECYFTPQQLKLTIPELDKKLNGITGVQNVKLVTVPSK